MFYKPLGKDEIGKIVDLLVKDLNKRLEDKQLSVTLTPAAKAFVINSGFDPVYGARPLRRFIQSKVETKLAKHILTSDIKPKTQLTVDYDGRELVIK